MPTACTNSTACCATLLMFAAAVGCEGGRSTEAATRANRPANAKTPATVRETKDEPEQGTFPLIAPEQGSSPIPINTNDAVIAEAFGAPGAPPPGPGGAAGQPPGPGAMGGGMGGPGGKVGGGGGMGGAMAPPKSELEQLLDKALKDNPDVRVAAAKIQEAEAELNRARLLVMQKVVVLHQGIQTQKELIERLKKDRKAEAALNAAKAELARLENELPYLLGKQTPEGRSRDLILHQIEHYDVVNWLQLNQPRVEVVELDYDPAKGERSKTPIDDRVRKALDSRVTVDYVDTPIAKVFADLKTKYGLPLVVKEPDLGYKVTLKVEDQPLGALIQAIADIHPIQFYLRDYGVLATTEEPPTFALRLYDFWKGVVPVTPGSPGGPGMGRPMGGGGIGGPPNTGGAGFGRGKGGAIGGRGAGPGIPNGNGGPGGRPGMPPGAGGPGATASPPSGPGVQPPAASGTPGLPAAPGGPGKPGVPGGPPPSGGPSGPPEVPNGGGAPPREPGDAPGSPTGAD